MAWSLYGSVLEIPDVVEKLKVAVNFSACALAGKENTGVKKEA
jgi:hypothetical protein